MGESQKQAFQLSFNRFLRVTFHGSRITSDGGLILVRELDERLGFGELIEQHLIDSRGKNTRVPLADLLRQSIYSRLAGYEDVNDAERLSQDPTFRLIGSEKIWERGAALTSRLQSFETELLTQDENLAGLAAINRDLIARAGAMDAPRRVVLDMDSTEIPVYGEQEQSAYNGHFESSCYHPLLLFSREGDCLAAKLRPGNVHSAEDWEELLLPEIERQQKLGTEVVFRADAAFAKPEIYDALEERDVKYAIRIPANDSLERDIAELLRRPVGRPSHKPVVWYKSFLYQAASWKKARRAVAKVEFHFGELFPRVGFIVTNLETDSRGGGPVLQQAGHRRAMDQGRQAGGKDDPAELPSVSVERGAPMAEPDRLQLGKPVAAAGATEEDQQLVADEFAAAAGENGRTAGETCAILLAFAGRRALEPEAVQQHAANDLGTAAARRLATRTRREGNFRCSEVVGPDKCQRRGRLGRRNPHSDSEEQPKMCRTTTSKRPGRFAIDTTG